MGRSLLAVVATACVLAVTGGVSSPLTPLLVMPALLSATLGGARGPFAVSVFTLAVIALLAAAGLGGWLPEPVPHQVTTSLPWVVGCLLGCMAVGTVAALWVRARVDRAHQDAHAVQQQAAHALRRNQAELAALSAALAHEIKNPLAALQGLATLMRAQGAGDEDARALATDIKAMGTEVERFLDFSRPMAHASLRRMSALELLQEARLSSEAPQCTLSAPDDLWLLADARKLRRILATTVAQVAQHAGPLGVTASATEAPPDGIRFQIRTSSPVATLPRQGPQLLMLDALVEQHRGTLRWSVEDGLCAELWFPQSPLGTA